MSLRVSRLNTKPRNPCIVRASITIGLSCETDAHLTNIGCKSGVYILLIERRFRAVFRSFLTITKPCENKERR